MDATRATSFTFTGSSMDGHAGRAASPPTKTFGREKDVAEVIGLLDRDDVRLVSFLGPGGAGKTRLAQVVMKEIAASYAHGARFVALDAVRDPDLVPVAVARAIGLEESADRPVADMLVDHLGDRHMLLVLDNMEQVTGAASPWLSGLIRQAPRLAVLVTSRIPLHIDVEHQYIVPPLAVDSDDAAASPAVRLFADRAQAVRHDFVLTEQNAGVVVEICRTLDGLPLAIELAAARVKILSPDALLARLTDRLTVLTGGHRDMPQRLRSMRDAIGWSVDLLRPEERRLFQRLSVFLGGFTLDAAEFVAGSPHREEPGMPAIDLLHSLVDQSLVQPPHNDNAGRYRMLETIREYGISLLEPRDAAFAAHADYVQDLARRAEPELIGPEQGIWNDLLEADYANLRAAVDWLERNGRIDDAILILSDAIAFIDVRGHTLEAMDDLERWLGLPAYQEKTRVRGLLLYAIGVLLHNTGDFSRGVTVCEESMQILLAVGDRYHAAIAGAYLVVMLGFTNDWDGMRPVVEQAIDLARSEGHHRALSLSLNMIADSGFSAGNPELDLSFSRQAYDVAYEHGDWWMVAFALLGPTIVAFNEGRVSEAERLIRESMRLRTMIGSKRDLPADWMFLAWATYQQGDPEQAEECMRNAVRIADETGHGWYKAMVSSEAAVLAMLRGDYPNARGLLLTRLDGFRTSHNLHMVMDALTMHGMLAHLAGDSRNAACFLGAGDTLQATLPSRPREPGFWLAIEQWRSGCEDELKGPELRDAYESGASWSVNQALDRMIAYQLPPESSRPTDKPPAARRDGLSPRERDVLIHMANGMSNQQIADALYVSHRTVTTHVTSIMTKLDAPSRTAAVAFAIRNGMA